jgi:hypothetical protein
MKKILALIAILLITGCNKEDNVRFPTKEIQCAEKPAQCYDTTKFGKLHIPGNCRIVGYLGGNAFYVILENSSGTQFVVQGGSVEVPFIVVRDLPDIWYQTK